MHVDGCTNLTLKEALTKSRLINHNTGCGIVDQSIASFGPAFNTNGGGVYAMKWDEISIDVCKFLSWISISSSAIDKYDVQQFGF